MFWWKMFFIGIASTLTGSFLAALVAGLVIGWKENREEKP